MTALPTGTVTFLFTDIEGSTRLLQQLGGAYAAVRDEPARLRRAAPADAVRDLGQHRLKDLAEPEHLHDLVIPGLESEFPPPRTLDARPSDLPVQLTSFVGRETEIAEVRGLLDRTRLLTLTGAGGTGKTRLALQVAELSAGDHADGACFVDLSSVTDPSVVAAAIARSLGVAEMAGRPILEP